jgi:hypothetical protein
LFVGVAFCKPRSTKFLDLFIFRTKKVNLIIIFREVNRADPEDKVLFNYKLKGHIEDDLKCYEKGIVRASFLSVILYICGIFPSIIFNCGLFFYWFYALFTRKFWL